MFCSFLSRKHPPTFHPILGFAQTLPFPEIPGFLVFSFQVFKLPVKTWIHFFPFQRQPRPTPALVPRSKICPLQVSCKNTAGGFEWTGSRDTWHGHCSLAWTELIEVPGAALHFVESISFNPSNNIVGQYYYNPHVTRETQCEMKSLWWVGGWGAHSASVSKAVEWGAWRWGRGQGLD